MIQLRSTTSSAVINTLKSTFARHGIPEILKSDNGPQFTAGEFDEFAKATTSSTLQAALTTQRATDKQRGQLRVSSAS